MSSLDNPRGIPAQSWSLVDQAKQLGFKHGSGLDNITGWFSPSKPLKEIAPPDAGWFRTYDYNQATNVYVTPKSSDETVSYQDLRALAENCDYVAICIQTVQDRLSQHTGMVVDVGGDIKNRSDAAKAIDEWLQYPDGVTPLHQMISQLVWEQSTTDSATLIVDKSSGMPRCRVIDGTTIAPRINEQGIVVGYQQIIKGAPAHDYDLGTVLWSPKNRRPNKLYGFSPVEQIYRIITLALRRTARQLDWFTDGAIPAMLISAPDNWGPDQIATATANWDSLVKGISGKEAVKFIPGGSVPHIFDRNPAQDEFDNWLIRVICYAFSIPPTAFIKETNRATAQTTQAASMAEGHSAILRWTAELLTNAINSAWGPGYEWRWDLSVQPSLAETTELLKLGALKPSVLQQYGYDPDVIEAACLALSAAQPSAVPTENSSAALTKAPDQPGEPSVISTTSSVENRGRPRSREVPVDPDFTKLLQGYIADLKQAATTAAVKSFETGVTVDLGDLDDRGLVIKAVNLITKSYNSGIKDGNDMVDAELDMDAKVALQKSTMEYAQTRAAEMVGMKWKDGALVSNHNSKWSIAQVTRDSIQADVHRAFAEGMTPSELRELIAQNPTIDPERALTIARTETAFAQSAGKVGYYKAAGVKKKIWSDSDGCEICQANAAQGPIDVDDTFASGDDIAPAHPNCTCDVLPYTESDDSNNDDEQSE